MLVHPLQFRVGTGNFCIVHVSLVPVIGVVGEQKTKPTQHSVATLRSLGLNPHMLACRSSEPLAPSVQEKLAAFCHVPVDQVGHALVVVATMVVKKWSLCCHRSQLPVLSSALFPTFSRPIKHRC